MSTHTQITSPELQAAAKEGGDKLASFIKGDESLNRSQRVERATEALRLLREEMKDAPQIEKKEVVGATRAVLQDAVDEIRGNIRESSDTERAALEEELRSIDGTKSAALEDERAMATPFEFVQNELRETANDMYGNATDWKTWAKYGAAAVGAGIAARYAWDYTIGALLSWFRTDPDKPTWFEKAGSWLAGVAGAVTGAAFLNAALRTTPGKVVKAGGEIVGGAGDEALSTGKEVAKVAAKDIDLVTRISTTAAEDPSKALALATSEGLPLLVENGSVAVWVMGKAITVPGLSLSKTIEWIKTGKQPEDYWFVWGASGVAYLVGSKAFGLLMYGKLDIPGVTGTRSDAIVSAAKVASGPLGPVGDALSLTSNAFRSGGRQALRIRFVSRSLPMRAVSWLMQPRMKTQAGIEAAFQEWKNRRKDARVMERFSGEGQLFSKAEADDAKHDAEERLDHIRDALAEVALDGNAMPELQRLKTASNSVSAETFVRNVDEYLVAKERAPAPQPQAPAPPVESASATPVAETPEPAAPAAEQSAPAPAEVDDPQLAEDAKALLEMVDPDATPAPVRAASSEGAPALKLFTGPAVDESLLTPEAGGAEHLDAAALRPTPADPTSLHRVRTNIKANGRSGTDTDTDTNTKTNVKGGRR